MLQIGYCQTFSDYNMMILAIYGVMRQEKKVGLAKRLMTTAEVARFLHISEWQVAIWRTRTVKDGPRYVKMGRRMVRYFLSDVIAFAKQRRSGALKK